MNDFLLTTPDRESYLFSILELIECANESHSSASRPWASMCGEVGSQYSSENGYFGADVN
jgi:hypothetical protein